MIMVKEPAAGRVKTRLGRDIGLTTAAWWYRHQTRRLLREVQDPRWDVCLAVAPDTALASRVWSAHLARRPQGPGDLGARMARALGAVRGPVLLIGSDIPGVRKPLIADAFARLGSAEAVIGPAPDGGFWLVGLKDGGRRRPDLFRGVHWSVETTLSETLPTLPAPVAQVATLQDVDTAADLLRIKAG